MDDFNTDVSPFTIVYIYIINCVTLSNSLCNYYLTILRNGHPDTVVPGLKCECDNTCIIGVNLFNTTTTLWHEQFVSYKR